MPLKKRFFLITALLYILYTIFPLFADIISIPVWLPSMTSVGVFAILYPRAFANRTFYWFLAYAVVLGICVLIGKPLTIGIGTIADRRKIIIEFAFILPTISIISILSYLNDIKLTRALIKWFVIILFASFIVAYPLMVQYNSLRHAFFDEDLAFNIKGLPSYSLMHSYLFIIPLLCYAYKSTIKHKWLFLMAIIASSFVIIRTDVGTCIILMVLLYMISLGYQENRSAYYWLLLTMALLILYFLYQIFFVELIDILLPYFEDTSFAKKLVSMQISSEEAQLSGNFETRNNLHLISFESFLANPLFGNSKVGGHSVLIDRLGGMGLVTFIPYIMIYISQIRQMRKLYQTKMARDYYFFGVLAGFVFLYEKGLWGCECWLMYMVVMPMGIWVLEKRKLKSVD